MLAVVFYYIEILQVFRCQFQHSYKSHKNKERLQNIIEYSENLYKEGNLVSHTEKALGITWNNLDILAFGVTEMFNVNCQSNKT